MANPDSKREIELLHIIGTLTDSYRTIREWANPEVDDLLGQIKEAMADATRMLQSVMKGPLPDMMKYEEQATMKGPVPDMMKYEEKLP